MSQRHCHNSMLKQRMTPLTSDGFEGATSALSVRARNILANLGIHDFETLLRLSHDDLLGVRNSGKKTTAEVVGLQSKIRRAQNCEIRHETVRALSFDNAPKEILEAVKAVLSVRGVHTLEDMEVVTLKDFMLLNDERLLKCRNCGRKTVQEIAQIQSNISDYANELANRPGGFRSQDLISAPCFMTSPISRDVPNGEDFFADVENPARWLRGWVQSLAHSKCQKRAFMLRKGMLGLAPMTLDLVGEQVGGVTRERARQMEKAVEERAASPHQQQRLRPLIQSAICVIDQRGGMIHLDELTGSLLCKGEDGKDMKFASELLSFFATLPIWEDAGLCLHKNGVVIHGDSRAQIRRLAGALETAAAAAADEQHGDGLWSISRACLKSALVEVLKSEQGERFHETLSDAALDAVLNRCKGSVKPHEDRVYSTELWRLRFGNVVQMAETVLRQIGSPAHFSEVAKEASKWRPNFSTRNTHATLDRCKKALLWNLGTFVHQDNVVVPLSLIHDAEAWLLKALNEDVPFVSANGTFLHFKSRCEKAGLPSDVALYTCLRRSAHLELVYPRRPCVYLKHGFTERLPILLALENFLRDAGGSVSQQELSDFAMRKIFLKDYQFSQLRQRVSNVIRTADWGYLHLDNFEIEQRTLQPVIEHIRQILAKEGHCSIDKIYRDKRVTCRTVGIDGAVMLYSVIQCFANGSFVLNGYPSVINPTNGDATERQTIRDRVINFVRDAGGPCPYEDMEESLVEGLGYKEKQIYSVVREPNVCMYHAGCVVHLESLGWDDAKQSALEEVAFRDYADAVRAGRCYARVSHLLESRNLPQLPTDLHWSHLMIADLLTKGRRFCVIGNSREALVPRDNNSNIHTIEDLSASLLNGQWGGAANLAEFEAAMVDDGIIKKHLTQAMLSPGDTVTIQNGEIILKELLVDA